MLRWLGCCCCLVPPGECGEVVLYLLVVVAVLFMLFVLFILFSVVQFCRFHRFCRFYQLCSVLLFCSSSTSALFSSILSSSISVRRVHSLFVEYIYSFYPSFLR